MNSNKKIDFKKYSLPVAFVILLVISVLLNRITFGQDKEALGTEVDVRVVDVKTRSTGLNPGGLRVTVSYKGEEYELHGVPSNAHFVMENSRKYRSTVSAILYNGKMYYGASSIQLWTDKIYYASLLATLFVFSAMVMQQMEKQRGNRRL